VAPKAATGGAWAQSGPSAEEAEAEKRGVWAAGQTQRHYSLLHFALLNWEKGQNHCSPWRAGAKPESDSARVRVK
jgi:hypothetical protein